MPCSDLRLPDVLALRWLWLRLLLPEPSSRRSGLTPAP